MGRLQKGLETIVLLLRRNHGRTMSIRGSVWDAFC